MNRGISKWTPAKLCEPEVSTLDISPSSLTAAEDTINRCVEPRTTTPTYPEYTVPVRSETQEPTAVTHPEGLTGSDSDQTRESNIAYVRSGIEKYTAEPMLEDSLKDPSSGDTSSVGEVSPDAQRDVAESVTLDSVEVVLVRPVLPSPSANALSVDESNNEAILNGLGISSGVSDIGQPNCLPTASQFKASRSISEIPEKTRTSAQCLVQVLNDFKVSKKFG